MSDACKKHPRLFGSSVSISNKLVLVGAPAIGHRGKVYTYLIKSSTKKQSYDPISAFGVTTMMVLVYHVRYIIKVLNVIML